MKTGKSQPVHCSSGKRGFAKFVTGTGNSGPEGSDFPVLLKTNDQFFFSCEQFYLIFGMACVLPLAHAVQYVMMLDVNKQF